MDPKGGLKIPKDLLGKPKVEFETLGKVESDKATHISMTRYREDLFPAGGPKLAEISQGAIGDCFLLAAIQAILVHPKGAESIHSLMVDLGPENPKQEPGRDNPVWVVVKLCDRRFKAHYIKLKKAAIVDRTTLGSDAKQIQTPLHTGPLWLSILVSAYTAFDVEGNYTPNQPSFARLNKGGHSDVAFTALTGMASDRTSILDMKDTDSRSGYQLGYNAVSTETGDKQLENEHRENVRLLFDVLPKPDAVENPDNRARVQSKVFNNNQASVAAYSDWLNADSTKVKSSWGSKVTYKKHHEVLAEHLALQKNKQSTTLRAEDLNNFFAQNSPNGATTEVVNWLRNSRVVSGKRFANNYTPYDESIFRSIESAVLAGRPMVLATREFVGSSTGSGHSAGEPMSKGLVGKHAYAITNVWRADTELWVEIRNPWGNYGREYQPHPQYVNRRQPVASNDLAQFWISLSDLMKRCANIYTCFGKFR